MAAALVLVGCNGGGDEPAVVPGPTVERIEGVPVLAGHVQGPGTDLGDGFEVADGTLLLGDVFPNTQSGTPGVIVEAGWSAYLVVTGDASAVLAAYAAQVEAADLVATGITCRDDGPVQWCSGFGRSPVDEGETFSFVYQRAASGPAGAPVSHLVLTYERTSLEASPTSAVVPDVEPVPTIAEPPVLPSFSPSWPTLPEDGDAYEVKILPEDPPPLTLRPGVELVAHPLFLQCCGALGSAAVFRVTGDPDEVLDSYLPAGGVSSQHERTEGNATVLNGNWTGGHGYDIEIVSRPDEPTYMLITHVPMD